MEVYLNVAAFSSAWVAAYFWLKSSKLSLPEEITVGFGGAGGSIQELANTLKKQSRYSAHGARAAMVTALLQGIIFLIP